MADKLPPQVREIKTALAANDVRIVNVCRRCGLEPSSVSRWLNGWVEPSLVSLRRFNQALYAEIQASRSGESVVVGIDPGAKGGIAVIQADGVDTNLLFAQALPCSKHKVNKGWQNFLDVPRMQALLIELKGQYDIDLVMMERVTAHPRQGVASTFNFGRAFGELNASTTAVFGMQPHLIQPKDWRHAVGAAGGDDRKENSRQRAIKLFGEKWFPRKKDTDIAEAALIAYAGRLGRGQE